MKNIIATACFLGILVSLVLTLVELYRVYQNVMPMKQGVVMMLVYMAVMFVCLGELIQLMEDDGDE